MPTLPYFRLSYSASGSIGHVMTGTKWKGCLYWRPYSYPSGGKTAAQAAVRKLFAAANRAWQRDFNTVLIRNDWNRSASYCPTRMSGYNQFLASAYHATVNDPDSVFVQSYYLDGNHLNFRGATISGLQVPTTSQQIDFWIGHNPWQQSYVDTREFHAGVLWSPEFPGPGIYYIRMTSQGVPISGLIRVKYLVP